jgi:NAD(P)-dependent dehydrogenase (short-subunit alcohol dehydrogenase family)
VVLGGSSGIGLAVAQRAGAQEATAIQSAVNSYSRNGFRVMGEESFRVGARDHEALVMRLALAPPAEGASRLAAAADADRCAS